MNNTFLGYFSVNRERFSLRVQAISRGPCTGYHSTVYGGGFSLFVREAEANSVPFRLLSYVQRDGIRLLVESRLDNREYLRIALGERELENPDAENALFVYYAYRKWGERFVDHLDGDWSVVLFEEDKRRLFLAVDHLATRSVFYSQVGDEILVSNSKRLLLSASPYPMPLNELFILKRLLISRISSPQTSHKDVFPVPPGHTLQINADLSIAKKRYWFFDRVKRVQFAKEEDYVEAFLAVYRKAVTERMIPGASVGCHLSGGLDSGSVSVLAAEALRASGGRLLAYTGTSSVPPKESQYKFDNEDYYAGLTAQYAGNIDQQVCDGTSYKLLDSIAQSVDIFQELAHGIGNLHWIYEISDRAKQLGTNLMLVGQQGNATVSWQGQRPATWKSSLKDAVKMVYWDKLQGGKSLASFRKIPRTFADIPSESIIKRDFLASFVFKDLLQEESDPLDRTLPKWVGQSRCQLMGLHNNQISVFWQSLSQVKGLIHWDPTNDADLMAFCLGIPEEFYRKNMRRHLIRRSMKGLLPDEVAFNAKKGLQSADWRERFLQEKAAFWELVQGVGTTHPVRQFLDMEALKSKMKQFEEGGSIILSGNIARAMGLIFLCERNSNGTSL
ncbi:asparagine synthase-related protein [Lunatimonas salinarum]|uniref:asparagine synthase-related protein n=1 Tax=Lunatimonas salinarum TaxID=1774590 RepID=UPI001ADF6B43|nr:asparagine synthase-related protein [Lunatimonas salinarum]